MALLSLSEMKFFVQLSPWSRSEDVLLPWGWETVSLGRFSLLRPLRNSIGLSFWACLLPSLYSHQLFCLPLSSVELGGLSFLFPTSSFFSF